MKPIPKFVLALLAVWSVKGKVVSVEAYGGMEV
jgi:hypothetical protein